MKSEMKDVEWLSKHSHEWALSRAAQRERGPGPPFSDFGPLLTASFIAILHDL
jgi:hypothetical protein